LAKNSVTYFMDSPCCLIWCTWCWSDNSFYSQSCV